MLSNWPVEVPILSPSDISNPSIWFVFRSTFKNDLHLLKAVNVLSQVSHVFSGKRVIGSCHPYLISFTAERTAFLFNVTMCLLGYTEGQSTHVLISMNRVLERQKYLASLKLQQDSSPHRSKSTK